MKKLIIVYNSGSSQFKAVETEVLSVARRVKGWIVGKFEVKGLNLDANAEKLAKILNDGDLVIAAGGDGTAAIVANAVLLSKKQVTFSALGYGNFNDMAHMLKTKRPVEYGDEYVGGMLDIIARFEANEIEKIYPLEVLVNGKHWRYAPCYVTIGLFAESTKVFDEEKVREKLKKGRRFSAYSWWILAKWYFKNRNRHQFLPEFRRNGELQSGDMTDYIAVNGTRLADVMKGGEWFLKKTEFGSGAYGLRSFWRLCSFMIKSILIQVPVVDTKGDVLDFAEPTNVEIQAEGEYQTLENVKKIEVRKVTEGLRIVRGK